MFWRWVVASWKKSKKRNETMKRQIYNGTLRKDHQKVTKSGNQSEVVDFCGWFIDMEIQNVELIYTQTSQRWSLKGFHSTTHIWRKKKHRTARWTCVSSFIKSKNVHQSFVHTKSVHGAIKNKCYHKRHETELLNLPDTWTTNKSDWRCIQKTGNNGVGGCARICILHQHMLKH